MTRRVRCVESNKVSMNFGLRTLERMARNQIADLASKKTTQTAIIRTQNIEGWGLARIRRETGFWAAIPASARSSAYRFALAMENNLVQCSP